MARSPYVWGIDIGKAALKALRCRRSETARKLVVDTFDYIEYPTFLSQPDADPVELVRNALSEFTGRHNLARDTVAISVPGQLGLSKFIKLPPIEAKKIPDIVKYEARQQIPFPLEQVVWDWQRLAGGIEESGFVIDAEVAIFAMKSEQVDKSLAPLIEAGIDVDILQLSPVALSNLVMFDLLPDPAEIDPENPPPSIALVSMGVDSTDLVVTNGLKIWQRSISIGGNSFTKAVVKDQKLTFARAEEVKRNAVRSEDPKAIYTAMRPVFDEFAVEMQRSLSYFTSTDRTAEIGTVYMLGNAAGMRGLSDFIGKQLGLPVKRLEVFRNLEADEAMEKPAYRENRLAFGTAYGLAVQAVGAGGIKTSLLPRRIVTERIIDSKKPWAAAALIGLLLSAVVAFIGAFIALSTFDAKLYADAFRQADQAVSRSKAAADSLGTVEQQQKEAIARQDYLLAVESRRFQSLDLLRALESLLPHDTQAGKDGPKPISERRELYIERLDCQYVPDLATWFTSVKKQWEQTNPAEAAAIEAEGDAESEKTDGSEDGEKQSESGEAAAEPAGEAGGEASGEPAPVEKGPQGGGWVVELAGHHFHNEPHHSPDESAQFLRSTLIKNLLGKGDQVLVSGGPRAGEMVPVAELGIAYPVIVASSPVRTMQIVDESRVEVGGAATAPGIGPGPLPRGGGRGAATPDEDTQRDTMITLRRYDFVVQFVWQPKTPGAPEPQAAEESAAAAPAGGGD
ncbi:MAG: type IV pilus assembly protein PilM [Planctomycetia bacterium]